jgi:hypothetical protein
MAIRGDGKARRIKALREALPYGAVYAVYT